MPDVAAFDFDGTLTDGGSVFGFLSAATSRPTVLAATVTLAPRLAYAAAVGGSVADQTKERLFARVLDGLSAEHVERVAARYADEHLARHLRPAVQERLDWHRRRGDRVVIVSASPELYVRVAGHRLGADEVIATRLDVRADGTLSGRYDGANCRGDEKRRRLLQWIDESGSAPKLLWSYGNSRGDLTMLRRSDIGVNVGRLGRLGRLRSFPGLRQTGPAIVGE